MEYISSRNKNDYFKASDVIINGLAKDGGLYVPSFFPKLTKNDFNELIGMSYEEQAAKIISMFLEDEYTYEELLKYTKLAYANFEGAIAPLVCVDKNKYILELWHGPTAAFKDMALSVMPYLLVAAKKKNKQKEKTLILVATSGDTGKAALEGFKDVDGVEIMVFYPSDGVSLMQKLQMATQEGKNVYVFAIDGNFDDAQSSVKRIFSSKELKNEFLGLKYRVSSANSINWGRLVPQIVYYISSYVSLLTSKKIKFGDKINVVVPTGNFGNILAAYYASRMGVPINRLICASNKNKVLTDFFRTGEYNANREFYKTTSPSMDILISSNLERLIFEAMDRDDKAVIKLMDDLKKNKKYSLPKKAMQKIDIFYGNYADEKDTERAISEYYDETGYLLDPHTSVGASVYNKYLKEEKDTKTPTILVATANPYKFPIAVYKAISGVEINDAFVAMEKLEEETGEPIPRSLTGIKERKVRFKTVIKKEDIDKEIFKTIKNN